MIISTSLRQSGIYVIRFNNPKKLNAWSQNMMNSFNKTLRDAEIDPSVRAVVITGTGKYYSAGVDLAQLMRPMSPRSLVNSIQTLNKKLFNQFIEFPKPIFAALNGPW